MRKLFEKALWSAVDYRGQEESRTTLVHEADYITPEMFALKFFFFSVLLTAMVESTDRAQTADPMRNSGFTH